MVLEQRQYVSMKIIHLSIFIINSCLFCSSDLAPGGSDDWIYDLGVKYSFTFELQDRGRYGFLLPPSHIERACNEALTALKTIARRVIEKMETMTSSPPTV